MPLTCAPNQATNGDFEAGAEPWALYPQAGPLPQASISGGTVETPSRTPGSKFYKFSTSATYSITFLTQSLVGLKAGDSVSCSIYYNFFGNLQSLGVAAFTLDMSVDGQNCGSQAVTPGQAQWVQVSDSALIGVARNSPILAVSVTIINPSGDTVTYALDDVRIIRNADSALPVCSSTPS